MSISVDGFVAGPDQSRFITGGFTAALARARDAAGGRNVDIAGGAPTVRQALTTGAVDELVLDVVPVVLGAGERLFDGVPDPRSRAGRGHPFTPRHPHPLPDRPLTRPPTSHTAETPTATTADVPPRPARDAAGRAGAPA